MRKQTVSSAAVHLRRAAVALRKVADQVDVAIHILTTPEPPLTQPRKISTPVLEERHVRDAIRTLGRMPQRLLRAHDMWSTLNDPQISEAQKAPVARVLIEIIISNDIPITPSERHVLVIAAMRHAVSDG